MAEPKDTWDKVKIVSAMLTPVVVGIMGCLFSCSVAKEGERDRTEERAEGERRRNAERDTALMKVFWDTQNGHEEHRHLGRHFIKGMSNQDIKNDLRFSIYWKLMEKSMATHKGKPRFDPAKTDPDWHLVGDLYHDWCKEEPTSADIVLAAFELGVCKRWTEADKDEVRKIFGWIKTTYRPNGRL
jgi:hypothetical protein